VVERTAARDLIQRLVDAARRDDSSELLGRGWQLSIIEDREQHLLDTLARRLRRATHDNADSFAVYNAAQPHVLRLAVAHVERVVLEAFVASIDGCPDSGAAELLGAVCDLSSSSTAGSPPPVPRQSPRPWTSGASGCVRAPRP